MATASLGAPPTTSAPPTIPTAFVQNRGQWDSRAQYLAQTPGLNLWVTSSGVVYDFHKFLPDAEQKTSARTPRRQHQSGTMIGDVVQMSFVDAHPSSASGVSPQHGTYNYLRGRNIGRFITGVPRFGEVRSQQVYDGIDARYYFDNGMPRYDLVVRPGADPGQIAMRLEGAEGVSMLQNGNLKIDTPMGPVEEQGLTVYQGEGASRKVIPSKMSLEGDTVTFKVGSYDASKSLVIDPVIFSTYLGGSGGSTGTGDIARSIAYSTQNNTILVGGQATSPNFPVTLGSYQNAFYEPSGVGFLAEFGLYGELLWCSFIEGNPNAANGYVDVTGITVDFDSNPVVAGNVYEVTLPILPGMYKPTADPTVPTGFALKLNSTGSMLTGCSYLGGTGATYVSGVALDGDTDIVTVGATTSTDMPTTSSSYQQHNTAGAGDNEGFVQVLSPDFTSAWYCTYLGGTSSQEIMAVATDTLGNILVTGFTSSTDFPTTANAFQSSPLNNTNAVFVSSLDGYCSKLNASTYVSGSGSELSYAISADKNNNIVLAGITDSVNFPTTSGAFQIKYPGHTTGFVSKVSADATKILASTFLGGSNFEIVRGVQVDANNNPVVCGETYSSNFPTTLGAYQNSSEQLPAAFITQFNPGLTAVPYSSLLGANVNALCLALYNYGNAASIAGMAGAVPFTPGSFQGANNDPNASNAFVSMVSMKPESMNSWQGYSVVFGGDHEPLVVYLSSVAPPGGAKVTLKSDNACLQVPAYVTVPETKTEGDFTGTATPVSVDTLVTVTMIYQGISTKQVVKVSPFPVHSLALTPASVIGGAASVGTVTLDGPAGPNGIMVKLSSNNAAAKVPATVTVPAGKTSVTFSATTIPVNANQQATLSAQVETYTPATATLTVTAPTLAAVSVSPSSIEGGYPVAGTATLTGNAGPAGVVVTLSSGTPSVATVPASVAVLSGKSSAAFTVTTHSVATSTTVTITAKSGSVTKSTSLTVGPLNLLSVTAAPIQVTGGTPSVGTVHMNGPVPAAGVVVSLKSSSPAIGSVPTSVTVAGGASSANFAITTYPVHYSAGVTITATYGSTVKTVAIGVFAPVISNLALNPTSVKGGLSSTGTVTLTGAASAAGVVVTLSSSSGSAGVPATVTVLPGKNSANFTVTTKTVSTTTLASIKGATGTANKSSTLTITP